MADPAAPQVRFPFVRLEFSFSLGPPPGRYPVARTLGGEPGGRDADDALLITLVGGPAAEPFFRRTKRVPADEPPREVSLLRVTWVQSSQPLADDEAARTWLADGRAEARREQLLAHATAELNRAIRAYAVAALDPYAREVSPFDARERRLGFGTGEELDAGDWTEAVSVPAQSGARVSRTDQVRPQVAVSGALLRRHHTTDGELHLLRALLDLDQGRTESAVRETALGLERLAAEQPDLPTRPAPESAAVEETVRAVLGELADAREAVWS